MVIIKLLNKKSGINKYCPDIIINIQCMYLPIHVLDINLADY